MLRIVVTILCVFATHLGLCELAHGQAPDGAERFIIDRNVVAVTPDGARIAALVVRPRTVAKQTTLLSFTIYANDDWAYKDAARMAASGYAGVVAYSRGKGRGTGAIAPYRHDGDDARSVIEWIAAQEWSDGRVGMFSGSYNSFTQWSAAKRLPSALKAIATSASAAPGIDIPMQGNIFQSFVYRWPLYVTKSKWLDEELNNDSRRWDELDRAWYASGRPYRDLEKLDREPNPVFAEWLRHPSYDRYWQQLIPYRQEFSRINIPVLATTGYFDGGMIGVLYYLREHYKYNPQANHRLLIGPYDHIAMQRGALANYRGYQIDPAAQVDLQKVRMQWFDHVFRGSPLPEILSDRINYQVMGANEWRHANAIEVMGRTLRLHLSTAKQNDRYELVAAAQKGDRIEQVIDLSDRSDAGYESPPWPLSDRIDTRNALVFVTQPLTEATEINGPFSAELVFAANKKDVDLGISMYEQRPKGDYFGLAYHNARASYVRDRSHRQLLTPGKDNRLRLASDTMTSRRLERGSRIVLVMSVIRNRDSQINLGTGKDVSDESLADAGDPLRLRWSTETAIDLRVSN